MLQTPAYNPTRMGPDGQVRLFPALPHFDEQQRRLMRSDRDYSPLMGNPCGSRPGRLVRCWKPTLSKWKPSVPSWPRVSSSINPDLPSSAMRCTLPMNSGARDFETFCTSECQRGKNRISSEVENGWRVCLAGQVGRPHPGAYSNGSPLMDESLPTGYSPNRESHHGECW